MSSAIIRFLCYVALVAFTVAYIRVLHWANAEGGYVGIVVVGTLVIGGLLLFLKLVDQPGARIAAAAGE